MAKAEPAALALEEAAEAAEAAVLALEVAAAAEELAERQVWEVAAVVP